MHVEDDLLKFKLSIRIGKNGVFKWLWMWRGCWCHTASLSISETADLLRISHTIISRSRVYRKWSKNQKISSEFQLCG